MKRRSTSNTQMSLALLDHTAQTHIQLIRQEMPAATSRLYFNAGTFGPLTSSTLHAMQERLQSEYHNGRLGMSAWDAMRAIQNNARQRVAHLLNADESEI